MNHNPIISTEEGTSNIKELLTSIEFQGNIDNCSALMFPSNSKLYNNVSVPSGHSPTNRDNIDPNEELFNQFTPDIRGFFSENNFNITVARDRKKKVKYEILQNADIILPIITFIGNAAFGLGTGILANYLYAKYVTSGAMSNSTIEADIVELKTENMSYKRYKISGSAQEVVEALKHLSTGSEEKPNNGNGTEQNN